METMSNDGFNYEDYCSLCNAYYKQWGYNVGYYCYGVPGPAGPQGERGPAGLRGERGPAGPAGPSDLLNLVDGNSTGSVRGIETPDDYTMGEYAIAVGSGSIASGNQSFASGHNTQATGNYSIAEGYGSTASGVMSHAEGFNTTASGADSHAEGSQTSASSDAAHAEGNGTIASGIFSHAEGYQTVANGENSHAEGANTQALSAYSHAEGISTVASSQGAHTEGNRTTASAYYSHAEGNATTAGGTNAHAEGILTQAIETASHAEGMLTQAIGEYSHAQGIFTTASGTASHAEGMLTQATGEYSHAEGVDTSTNSFIGAHVMGIYGDADTEYSWFLANGTTSTRSLACKILGDGNAYIDVAWNVSGADYAEMFETSNGKSIEPGYFVTIAEAEKIKIYDGSDDYIVGVVSAAAGVIGDVCELRWKDKYLKDKWGQLINEEVTVDETKDKDGNVIVKAYTRVQPKLNPDWDATKEYISRKKRAEWVTVGLLGKVLVRDDGSCMVRGYCKPNSEGIATASSDGYKVINRLDSDQIKIILK